MIARRRTFCSLHRHETGLGRDAEQPAESDRTEPKTCPRRRLISLDFGNTVDAQHVLRLVPGGRRTAYEGGPQVWEELEAHPGNVLSAIESDAS